jgi:hypothetical protein
MRRAVARKVRRPESLRIGRHRYKIARLSGRGAPTELGYIGLTVAEHHGSIEAVSRVTTLTLPDELYRALLAAKRRRRESMGTIIRRALDRELAPPPGGGASDQPGAQRRRPARRLPPSVLDWLDAPAGSFAHLEPRAGLQPTDWDPDAPDAGVDVD